MASEKKFVQKALEDLKIIGFLEKLLEKAGVSSISIQRTPIATRITMHVQKPGMVVGKRGAGINDVVESLKKNFPMDNPQIEVLEVPVPSLDAKLMAEKIGRQIELRGNVKQIMRLTMQEIMHAGALGSEIRVAGKIVGKGGKAKTVNVRAGFLKKSGDLVKLVRVAHFTAYPKAGAIGVRVRILPPGVLFSDKVKLSDLKFPEASAEAPAQAVEASPQAEVPQVQEPVAPVQEKPAEEKLKKKVARKKKEEQAAQPEAGPAAEKPKE